MKTRNVKFLLITMAMFAFAQSSAAMNIYVGNLFWSTTSDDLQSLFEKYGEVSSARVVTDPLTGRSAGYGFVEMPNDDEAKAAIDALNGTNLDGRIIVVRKASSNESGGSSRPGAGGFGPKASDPKPANTPKALPEKVLDQTAVNDVVADATDWLSDLIDDEEITAAITEKWTARKDLVGKTRTQILALLLADAKSLITDKAVLNAFVKGWNEKISP